MDNTFWMMESGLSDWPWPWVTLASKDSKSCFSSLNGPVAELLLLAAVLLVAELLVVGLAVVALALVALAAVAAGE